MTDRVRDQILYLLTCLASFSTILVWGMIAFHTGFVQSWPLTTLSIGACIEVAYIILLVRISDSLQYDNFLEKINDKNSNI